MTSKITSLFQFLSFITLMLLSIVNHSQVTVTASAGTTGPTSYTTLKGSFTAINAGTHQGNIVITISANTTETGALVLNASGSGASNFTSLLIQPAAGSNPVVSGNVSNDAFITFNSASNVTIDGSNNGTTTRNLSIINNGNAYPEIIRIGGIAANPIHDLILKNCILKNGSNDDYGIEIGAINTTTTSGYFHDITIQNNLIRKSYSGIVLTATVNANNGINTLITGNDLNDVGANGIAGNGVVVRGVDGMTISNNNIANFVGADSIAGLGIWIDANTKNTTLINNNISNLVHTGFLYNYAPTGIYITTTVGNANIKVVGNNITGLKSTGSFYPAGISLNASGGGITMAYNKISNIKNTNSIGYGAAGIYLGTSINNAAVKAYNNFIWDVASVGYNGYGVNDNGNGIVVNAGSGYDISYNTVALTPNTTLTTANNRSSAFLATSNVSTGSIKLTDNILVNLQAGTNANSRLALSDNNTNSSFTSIDYNDYFSNSGKLTSRGNNGSMQTTIAGVQTSIGGNANAVNILPIFNAPNDLHLTLANNLTLNDLGTPLAGITDDIDGDIRNTITPDMGADEFPPCAPANITMQPVSNTYCEGDTAIFTVNTTNGILYQWQQSTGGNYTNVSNSAIYTGATNDTLLVYNSTTAMSGSKFVCTITTKAGCPTSNTDSVTLIVNPKLTPIFTPIGAFCSGSIAPVLPLTSTNGITGTWNPATVSNTTSATYTFTPTTGQCATTATLNVTVTPNITPTFTPIAAFCSGSLAPVLPLTSTNGITGTWNPATVSNTASATYSFTPASGQCATTATLNVTITPNITPTFTPIAAFCSGSVAPVLPLTSTNGITGTWNPATVDNTTSDTYTFTPTIGQCATTATLNVTITPNTTPTFTPIAAFCSGSIAPVLPLTSTNGIIGTWNPATVDNTTSATYTFTPANGQCATTATLNVTITPNITPTFTPIAAFCSGSVAPVLPLTSTNGITGTWNPATVSNTASATYTFTPTTGQCATTATLNVTITPNVTPTFAPIAAFCSGSTAPSLLNISLNGVVGAWVPAIINNLVSGTYMFTPAVGSCAVSASINVIVKNPVAATDAKTICTNQLPYLWNGNNNAVNGSTYTAVATNGCDSVTTLQLTVLPPPVTSHKDTSACGYLWIGNTKYDQSTTISDTFRNALGCDSIIRVINLVIYPNTPKILTLDTAGCDQFSFEDKDYTSDASLTDTFRSIYGCDSIIRIVNIHIDHFELSLHITPTDPYKGEVINLQSSANNEPYFVTSWSPLNLFNDPTKKAYQIYANEDATVIIAAIDDYGCRDTAKISYKIKPLNYGVFMPNAFSPNGDGLNDLFGPNVFMSRSYTVEVFKVYNRWGQMVYSASNTLNAAWDGTQNGKLVDIGSYNYYIVIRFLDGKEVKLKGDVTLLR
jgi:gliding motility-associated-like protein